MVDAYYSRLLFDGLRVIHDGLAPVGDLPRRVSDELSELNRYVAMKTS